MNLTIFGDCRDTMRDLKAQGVRVQCCVTSPPYYGLRDYGHPGQIGLEDTPQQYVDAMVQTFRLVRDLLADDGVLWLNLGDSYAAARSYQVTDNKNPAVGPTRHLGRAKPPEGLKQKDLIGIPWAVATALRNPYYSGRIKDINDRVWLAAMIDGEGCMFIHKRKAGTDSGAKFTKADGTEVSYTRNADTYGAGLEVANTHLSIIENCIRITGVGSVVRQEKGRNQPLYRWNVRSNECRWIIQEVYPHLVAKQHQARLLLGAPSSGERADAAHQALIGLHNGTPTDVDFKPPESLFQPGYYLRQDVIWAKLNPMPESVRDRCTKAHEYLFLLSKSERYFWDYEAMQEPATFDGPNGRQLSPYSQGFGRRTPEEEAARRVAKSGNKERKPASARGVPVDTNGKSAGAVAGSVPWEGVTRNRRSVWTVPTKPYSGAHFAVFPADLIEPCILAGSRPGDVVLDPFMGSGTTAEVAQRLGRRWIGCELNREYEPLQQERTRQGALVL